MVHPKHMNNVRKHKEQQMIDLLEMKRVVNPEIFCAEYPPCNPVHETIWLNTVTQVTYIYYDCPVDANWVRLSSHK